MKKLLLKLVTVLTASAIATGIFAGCNLFTVNTDRDMAQVVATVQIDPSVNPDNIYKRELRAGYVSYGYYYVQNQGYTTSAAYNMILNNLVNNSIIVQQSRLNLADKYVGLLPDAAARTATLDDLKEDKLLSVLASDDEVAAFEKANASVKQGTVEYYVGLNDFVYDKYKSSSSVGVNDDAFLFVEEVKIYSAVSAVKESVNGLIASFEDETEEETTEHENVTYSPRAVPTMDAEEEEEEDIADYKSTAIDFTGTRASSFAKAVANLKKLGVIDSGDNYVAKDEVSVLCLSYFRNSVNSTLEGELVALYEQGLKNTSNIDYTKVDELYTGSEATAKKQEILDNLWEQYTALQKAQEAQYAGNISELETKLGNVGASNFVVYNEQTGYSYVSHLVVQFDEQQKALIDAFKEKDGVKNSDVTAYVDNLVGSIVVKDLRDSWVLSGYGTVTNDGGDYEFTFSDRYVYNTEGKLSKFLGTIGSVSAYTEKDDDGNETLNFRFGGVKADALGYDDFAALAAQVITGDDSAAALTLNTTSRLAGYTDDSVRIEKKDFDNFEDLKFAFSTDTGNFNKYLGYLYSPYTSASQYVKAFAEASVAVTEEGVGAYRMFASPEYGLHIVLCTAVGNYGYYADKDAFTADLDKALGDDPDKNTVAYGFMKANVDLVTDNYIGNIAQSFINKYTASDAKVAGTNTPVVQKYGSAYNDLITE